jgi:hypothetical protein
MSYSIDKKDLLFYDKRDDMDIFCGGWGGGAYAMDGQTDDE